MNKKSGAELVNKNLNLATNSVTSTVLKTHCIICGGAFQVSRAGKLYCSPRCKQFGYNHKDEINQAFSTRDQGINPKPMTFYIDDFTFYDKLQKNLKRYRQLEQKRSGWEAIDEEIKLRKRLDLPISDYLWNTYVNKKQTENEEFEFVDLENQLEEKFMDFNLKELSLEQWSFIQSFNPGLNDIAFLEVVSSLGQGLLSHLNLKEISPPGNNENLLIKNKFINHCNMIVAGIIQFHKRDALEGS